MIPKFVKIVSYSDLRHVDGKSLISTKLLKKLNVAKDEPVQIVGGAYGGTFIIVREFRRRGWQSYINITSEQAEFYFTNLFKCDKKKEEYCNLEQQYFFKKLKECEAIEDELFEIVGYVGDTRSDKKVIVHEFCDANYQRAIPIEKVNLWALLLSRCKRVEGYLPDIDWTQNTLKELYERRMNMKNKKRLLKHLNLKSNE